MSQWNEELEAINVKLTSHLADINYRMNVIEDCVNEEIAELFQHFLDTKTLPKLAEYQTMAAVLIGVGAIHYTTSE